MDLSSDSKPNQVPFFPIVLTEEEREECQAFLRTLTESEPGRELCLTKDLVDSFKRSIIALCMMGRAQRFAILSHSQGEYREKGCQAAAKACGIFPLSIYLYDFARVLQETGEDAEARQVFADFLRMIETENLDPIMRITLDQRDVGEAIAYARQMLQTAAEE